MLRECSSRHQSVAYHQCASTLQMFTGVYRVIKGFFLQYLQGKQLQYMQGFPCNL